MEELRRAARQQHEEGDLPEDLLGEILETLDKVETDTVDDQLLQQLIEQIRDYDSYAGAGCFSTSFGPEDIRRTLKKLLP